MGAVAPPLSRIEIFTSGIVPWDERQSMDTSHLEERANIWLISGHNIT